MGDELNYKDRWLPQFYTGDLSESYVAQATMAPGSASSNYTLPLLKTYSGSYYIWMGSPNMVLDHIDHKLLYIDCFNSTQNLISGARVVNFTTDYDAAAALKYISRAPVDGNSVELMNDSPVAIFESVSKSYSYESVMEQSVDKSSSSFYSISTGLSTTVGASMTLDIFQFTTSVTASMDTTSSYTVSESTHNYKKITTQQTTNSTKQVTVPPYTKTLISFSAKHLNHPSINYQSTVLIEHTTLSNDQIMTMLKGQEIADTCAIEANGVLCTITGSLAVKASLGLDFQAIGSNITRRNHSEL